MRTWKFWLSAVLWLAAGAASAAPTEADVDAAKAILHAIHENTEAKYREVSRLSRGEQEAALDAYVNESLAMYVDLAHMARRALAAHWSQIESGGLTDAARHAVNAEVRENLQVSFEAYERGERLKLLRIQSLPNAPEEIRISGLLGSNSPVGGRLPFSFITVFHQTAGEWRIKEIAFLGASLIEFVRSNIQQRIDAQGLQAALESYHR